MKILIVTDTIPFPPLNGRELPIAKIFEIISGRHAVDLLVLSTGNKPFSPQLSGLPKTINYLGNLPVKRTGAKKKIISIIQTFKYPVSPYSYSLNPLKEIIGNNQYDYVWISPVSYYSFIPFCNKNNFRFFKKAALGLNDSKTYQYRDSLNELLHSKAFKPQYIKEWLLSFLIEKEEKGFLALADIVHVQTQNEYSKLLKILPASAHTKIVAAPNGVKEELFACSYNGVDSNTILYMTHLDGDRQIESEWFIKKVWQKIKEELPNAKLLIVGKPPAQPLAYIKDDTSIIVNGYAADMVSLFNNVRLAVVPTFHGTGLINRILDALTAGVPVISTPQAIATFPGLDIGKQIIAAGTVTSYATAVTTLYNNKEQRLSVAANGKKYAAGFATWQQSAEAIEKAMIDTL